MNKYAKIAIICTFGMICSAILLGAAIGTAFVMSEDCNTTKEPIESIVSDTASTPTPTPSPIPTPIVTATPTPAHTPIVTATPVPASTPKSISDTDFDGIREFENVQMQFISYTFDTHGKIEQIGDAYRIECSGWNENGRVYAIIVNEVIDNKDYSFILVNHGHGSIEYDYEISDRKLKEMISNAAISGT